MEQHNFSKSDLEQIEAHELSVERVEQQLDYFRKGFPFVKLLRPATPDEGLTVFGPRQLAEYVSAYDSNVCDYDIVKFVPASGAATRMFKDLFTALSLLKSSNEANLPAGAKLFLQQIDEFSFYDELKQMLASSGQSIDSLLENEDYLPVLSALLLPEGLHLGAKPKAFIPFHESPEGSRTALEEQIFEGLQHAVGCDEKLKIHFTISPEHEAEFLSLTEKAKQKLNTSVDISITYSFQQKSTDTIAVDLSNHPIRDAKGKLIFRPGGHGALLQNLNAIEADMVFLKNIDNVVPDIHRADTIQYKKAIGGYLMSLSDTLHGFLAMLDDGNVEESDLNQMLDFASEKLFVSVPDYIRSGDALEKMDFLFPIFNRPIRVCGMVKNEGEPGGGPFIVEHEDGSQSLQIVESSQVNFDDAAQKAIFKSATHFNPVDLVCYMRDFEGDSFDLTEFADPETGFIARKSVEGRDIKAMELPGLWNGGMADWNTVFVEVPLSTFNPVKEVNDLLREKHRV